jgi:hypothetical protein
MACMLPLPSSGIVLSHTLQKFIDAYLGVMQCSPQSKTIDLIVKRKDDHSTVFVPHLHMAALSMNLFKTQTP